MTTFAKWLGYYRPGLLGLTSKGIAAGMMLTHGSTGWFDAEGVVVLYRGATLATIDTDWVVGAAGPTSDTIRPFAWLTKPTGSQVYRCVAIGGGGVECVQLTAQNTLTITHAESGDASGPVPASPRGLRVVPTAGGTFRLLWRFRGGDLARPSTFRIYSDSGTETMDWVTPLASVTARSVADGDYAWASDAFDDEDTVQFAVRARTAGGVEDANVAIVSGVADATGPDATEIVTVTVGDDA